MLTITTTTVIAKITSATFSWMLILSMFSSLLSLGSWEWILIGATFLVLVGVIGDFVVQLRKAPKPITLGYLRSKAWEGVLIVGIAGELVAGIATATISNGAIAAADVKAAGAVQHAANLGVTLEGLDAFTRARMRSAEALMAKVERQEGLLEAATADAGTLLSKVAVKQKDLEEAVAPRFLDQMQPVPALRGVVSAPVVITAAPGKEPSEFADEIAYMLKFAGWRPATVRDDGHNRLEGVRIEILREDLRVAAIAICRELAKQSIDVTIVAPSKDGRTSKTWPGAAARDSLLIRVGPRPDRFFVGRWTEKSGAHLEVDMPRKDDPLHGNVCT